MRLSFYCPKTKEGLKLLGDIGHRTVWSGFIDSTTTHGVTQINRSHGYLKKMAWILAFVACMGGLGYQLYAITSLYLKYKVTPVVMKQSARQLEFPAVSVCNTNPIRASALHLSPTVQALIDSWQKKNRKKRDVQDKVVYDEDKQGHPLRVKRQTGSYYGNFSLTYSTLTQTTAKSQCAAHCTTCRLADIESQTEEQKVLDQFQCDGFQQAWLGLQNVGGSLQWVQNSRPAWQSGDWTHWEPGEPDCGVGCCARIRKSDGQVSDTSCGGTRPVYVCEGDFTSPCEPNPCQNGGTCCVVDMSAKCNCPVGSEGTFCDLNYYGNFSLTYSTLTQTSAKSQCAAHCTTCRLADIESQTEEQKVLDQFQCDGFQQAWLGLQNVGGSLQWVQNSRPAWQSGDWTHWEPGEPDCGVGCCARIKKSDGEVSDTSCGGTRPVYVCEGDFISPCDPNPCQNGGTCCVIDMSAKCNCPAGTEGSFCYSPTTIDTKTTLSDSTVVETTLSDITTTVPHTTSDTETTLPDVKTTLVDTSTIPETTTVSYSATTLPDVSTTLSEETTTVSTITTTMVTSPTTSNVISSFPDRKPRREDFLRESEFMEVLVDLPMETKKKIGYELYEMVLSCGYENHKCNMSEFSWFFDAVYGNCYVFNSGWLSQQTSYPAKRPGRSKGLRMTFNLGQHEYLSGIARSAGIVVVVHPQTRMPFPEDEGVFAAPGYLTSIGLNKVSISRLPHPYGNCSEKTRNPLINVYEEDYNVEYSSLACYKTCYQKYVTQRCNCSDPQYPSKGQTFGGKNWTACSVRDIKQDDCLYGVTHDYISNTLICNCPTPCRETTYRYSVSRSQWPSQAYMNDFMKQHTGSLGNLRNHSSIDSFVQSNIVSVEVYFNEFNYQSISEKPGYPIHIYLADGCSILGLWLGMSLFSLTEVIELAADLVIVTCCKNKKKFNQIVISGVNYQEAPVKHVPVVTITQSRRLPTFPAKVQWTQYANKSGNNITSRRISNRGKMKDNMDMRDRQNISTKY